VKYTIDLPDAPPGFGTELERRNAQVGDAYLDPNGWRIWKDRYQRCSSSLHFCLSRLGVSGEAFLDTLRPGDVFEFEWEVLMVANSAGELRVIPEQRFSDWASRTIGRWINLEEAFPNGIDNLSESTVTWIVRGKA